MKLSINDDINPARWNAHAGDNIFHRFEWSKIISETYGLSPVYVMAESGREFALYPSFRLGKRCHSVPFTYLVGGLDNSSELRDDVLEALQRCGCTASYKYPDEYREEDHTVTAVIELDDPDRWFAKLSSKMRNQIKKSETKGFHFCKERDIEAFYPVYSRKMHELGTPPHKKNFFRAILQQFDSAAVYTVRQNGVTFASMFCLEGADVFHQGIRTLYIMWAAATREGESSYANYFLYWSVIKLAREAAICRVDLGTAHSGSYQLSYKLKWRPKLYAVRQAGGDTGHYKDKKMLLMLSAVWRKLPYWLIRLIGPSFRKYLP